MIFPMQGEDRMDRQLLDIGVLAGHLFPGS
jgi:hypothetical protein